MRFVFQLFIIVDCIVDVFDIFGYWNNMKCRKRYNVRHFGYLKKHASLGQWLALLVVVPNKIYRFFPIWQFGGRHLSFQVAGQNPRVKRPVINREMQMFVFPTAVGFTHRPSDGADQFTHLNRIAFFEKSFSQVAVKRIENFFGARILVGDDQDAAPISFKDFPVFGKFSRVQFGINHHAATNRKNFAFEWNINIHPQMNAPIRSIVRIALSELGGNIFKISQGKN